MVATCAMAPSNWYSNIQTGHTVCVIWGHSAMSWTCPGHTQLNHPSPTIIQLIFLNSPPPVPVVFSLPRFSTFVFILNCSNCFKVYLQIGICHVLLVSYFSVGGWNVLPWALLHCLQQCTTLISPPIAVLTTPTITCLPPTYFNVDSAIAMTIISFIIVVPFLRLLLVAFLLLLPPLNGHFFNNDVTPFLILKFGEIWYLSTENLPWSCIFSWSFSREVWKATNENMLHQYNFYSKLYI